MFFDVEVDKDTKQYNFWHKAGWMYEGYSDFWRRNKSIIEAAELANVIRALRKVAGQIGSNVGGVEWAGMSRLDLQKRGIITVDPSFIIGDYPVPPGKMDILVGIVVHEALFRKEWSDLVWAEIERAKKDLKFLDKDLLHKMVAEAEYIYVDKLAERSVLGLYVRKTRQFLFERMEWNPSLPPLLEMLFVMWRFQVLDEKKWDQMNPLYLEPLDILSARMLELVNNLPLKGSVTERCKFRSNFYLEMFEAVHGLIGSWKRETITYFDGERPEPKRKVKSVKKKAKSASGKEPLSLKLASEIEEQLAVGSSDLTPLIKAICGEDDPDVINTSLWDFTIPAHPSVDPYLVARLKGTFYAYANRITVVNRGLESGKIDKSRLYRAPMTKRCFMQKQLIPELSWNIAVLVDASRSMEGPKWRLVESVVASFYKALEGQKNKLQAFGYFEHDGVAIISELIRKGKLYSIPPNGRTPSGQAILAAALLLPKEKKRRFIIHVTDGESNCGCDVKHALDYCKKEKIDLVTLGCGYKERDMLVKQYGKSLEFLDYFEQLPKALENLLRRKLLFSAK
jgi:Mg-chelatase subunit ChlD